MTSRLDRRSLIVGVTPCGEPNDRLVIAIEHAGALGVLDLGRDPRRARRALRAVASTVSSFGVRVGPACPIDLADLPDAVDTVVLDVDLDATWSAATVADRRRVLVEVTCVDEALRAVETGAHGLIARGNESGGRVGETSTFVLLQQLAAHDRVNVPVWAAGGIGLHTAAAAMTAGATGVVLDAQLALTRESDLPAGIADAISVMDGSETTVVNGHRVYTRPDLPVPAADEPVAARLGGRDLHRDLLPIGQDGALARGLAEQYPTAAALVAAVHNSIISHLASAVTSGALGEEAPLARSLGIERPIAQGPMTRVSDRAGFARSVADAGGLPFIALALMRGDETRALLEETAELLGDRPWGVGILGFVPPELRDEQLAVVHDVQPPCALIAGGRPAQAQPLEEAGIATFLHVPSPGLLDRFLADGARRLVFEGRECGGHVGPRSSFALWDSQIERLLAFGASTGDGDFFTELQVLFAGGVHDERSAAAVAAMAAPLTARGAGVGVLMGTAYLFTEEAVASGAITSSYQQAAVECGSTVLLETSPGHATRCADTEYVRMFTDTRQRLQADGKSQQEIWAELEDLNLGRLRMASKGIRRVGDEVVPIDEDGQRRDGMVMIGDVATLRPSTTTVAELHQQVSDAAMDALADRAAELGIATGAQPDERADPLDIAIVGMAGVFAGAPTTDQYWANVVAGLDMVTEVPPERWRADLYYDPDAGTADAGRKTPSKWGGFLPDIPFDALAYGVPPSSMSSIDTSQLLALEVAARALADAGYANRQFDRSRTSVVFGAEGANDLATAYGFRALYPTYAGPLPPTLDEHLPEMTEDSFPGVLGNVIAGRIANRLDLGGLNYTVDAACASSLAALDAACKELRTGASDMALCGGVDMHNGLQDYLLFASVHALSPTGHCRTFDSSADGIALGEGAGCVVLKRLDDAKRDGDRVYAVIKGVAASSDGRSLGLTAPRRAGQRLALERAYRSAGMSPADAGLVEAHGTGTVVGDRTELSALTEVFTEAGAAPGGCALGSVKSFIGHTKCAAGFASVIKVAKALHAGVRPPTGQLSEPNPYWDADSSPFFFDTAARPWIAPPAERIAGVSGFGFGGTNFHVVLAAHDEAPEPDHGLDVWPAELFLIRGDDRTAAETELDWLRSLLAANDDAGRPWSLGDIAFTNSDRGQAPVQLAIVADDLDDLAIKLDDARRFEHAPRSGVFVMAGDSASQHGDVALLFPGQGSQRPGMLADLFVAFPRLRHFAELGRRWAPIMFPPTAFSKDAADAQRAAITDTRVAQPTLGIAGLAMNELLGSLGVVADRLGGHSYGELVALAAADAIDPDDLLELSEARANAIVDAAGDDPGTMAAVAAPIDVVRERLGDEPSVVVANHNGPNEVVISGPTDQVDAVISRLHDAGVAAKKIPVACAFHSPVVAGASSTLAAELARTTVRSPEVPVWSNTTAAPHDDTADGIRALLTRQVGEPVRFVEQVESMYDAGTRVFVEAGPGRVLTKLVGKILGDRPHTAVAMDAPGEHGLRRLLLSIAELATVGVDVDTTVLYRGRNLARASAADVPARPGWLVNGQRVRTASGADLDNALLPVDTAPEPVANGFAVSGSGAPSDREAAVLEFLQGTRELVAAQRDVLLGYLGTSPASSPQSVTSSALDVPMAGVLSGNGTNGSNGASASGSNGDHRSHRSNGDGAVDPGSDEPPTADELTRTILAIISQRTGYPSEMLDPALDLEADLSIDSIKRTEILGELAERVALGGSSAAGIDESTIEELSALRTVNAMVEWIVDHQDDAAGPSDDGVSADDEPAVSVSAHATSSAGQPVSSSTVVVRDVVEAVPLDAADAGHDLAERFAGARVTIVDGELGIGLELAELLESRGAAVRIADAPSASSAVNEADILVHLVSADVDRPPVLPEAFETLRGAVIAGTKRILVVTGRGGRFGQQADLDALDRGRAALGLAGLVRTLRIEHPDLVSQLLDVDPKDGPTAIAERALRELSTPAPPAIVGDAGGERTMPHVRRSDLVTARAGHDVGDAVAALGLGPDSVVLLTGGARGITAHVARALAATTGCHIELIARSPIPGEEAPAFADAVDAAGVRQVLISQGGRTPAEIEAIVSQMLAEREIRATLDTLAGPAASVRYHGVDVRDAAEVRAAIDDVYSRHGRLDGVIHGAGVLDDKLLVDKELDSFRRVFATKVDGAQNIVGSLRPDVGFVVLFGSISGVLGNRGQSDYAAANDALDGLAVTWSRTFDGRVLAVDWGPWAASAGGMVTPELEREYQRRGMGLVEPDAGVAALLAELAWGPPSLSQVVFTGRPQSPQGEMPRP